MESGVITGLTGWSRDAEVESRNLPKPSHQL